MDRHSTLKQCLWFAGNIRIDWISGKFPTDIFRNFPTDHLTEQERSDNLESTKIVFFLASQPRMGALTMHDQKIQHWKCRTSVSGGKCRTWKCGSRTPGPEDGGPAVGSWLLNLNTRQLWNHNVYTCALQCKFAWLCSCRTVTISTPSASNSRHSRLNWTELLLENSTMRLEIGENKIQ